jgi:5-hydroxyisourate hydrolase
MRKKIACRGPFVVAGMAASLFAASVSLAPAAEEGRLTTHVLDTASGRPAAGIQIDFAVREGERYRVLKTVRTNPDGRVDEPLLQGATMEIGHYRLVFHVADYFAEAGVKLADPPFLNEVPLDFAIADPAAHYHVPLLTSPWSYTTYRGS